MELFALPNHKVVCKRFNDLYYCQRSYDSQSVDCLKLDEVYTVAWTSVYRSSSTVYLKEIPNFGFSQMHFDDSYSQMEGLSRKHPDFLFYSGIIKQRVEGSGFENIR